MDNQFDIKEFAKKHYGKQITGTPAWFNDYANTQSSFYAVSKYMPIGTIVGYKAPNKIYFTPSDHWRLNGYIGHYNADFEYLGSGKKPMVDSIGIDDVVLYDATKRVLHGKPQNYKDFAYIYADMNIAVKTSYNFRWKAGDPIGVVIGYAAAKENKGYVYYIPSPEYAAEGNEGRKFNRNDIIYTIDGMNDDNVPLCNRFKMDDINLYTDPIHKVVDVHDAEMKPMPPKGAVDGDQFAVKYVGKSIKATYKYGHYLNAINPWSADKPIGTIIGVDAAKKICFAPSKEFIDAGWTGVFNFGQFSYTGRNRNCDRYYTIDLADIELLTPQDYENQNCGELLTDDGLTTNQKFAMEYAGRTIIGKGITWSKLLRFEPVIGRIAGYKGSLICYTPSQDMIKAGYEGSVIDDMVYTDLELAGEKCYTLISTASIRLSDPDNAITEFCHKNHSKRIKAVDGLWLDLVNDKGEKWNMNWPVGDIIGYHKVHDCLCFTPSKQFLEFGFNRGNTCYVGVDNHAKAIAPYYQLFDVGTVEIDVDKVRQAKISDGAAYAKRHLGKEIKRCGYLKDWDKTKIAGRIVGYKKSNGSIIWVPTEEYAHKFPPHKVPEDATILATDFEPGTLIHSCWYPKLDVVSAELKDGWFKSQMGGWYNRKDTTPETKPLGPITSAATTPYVATPKKKKRVRDRPWDKPITIEPLDMPPYIEMSE